MEKALGFNARTGTDWQEDAHWALFSVW